MGSQEYPLVVNPKRFDASAWRFFWSLSLTIWGPKKCGLSLSKSLYSTSIAPPPTITCRTLVLLECRLFISLRLYRPFLVRLPSQGYGVAGYHLRIPLANGNNS
ncbi:hypothetical protein [Parasitella parasitica]|uniref:Uncharacterized protein n=1 Tax=Parasitella parasitica TaxID=35722 RepID=A0A0B7NU86_9FUNG|nr:hypothetical protein [Parasitella parasitica]